MKEVPKIMLEHLDLLIQNKEQYNNYLKDGYEFYFEPETIKLIVNYKSKEYVISIIEEEKQLYWHLIPYNNSVFNTAIENGLNVVLFSIKENEKLYS